MKILKPGKVEMRKFVCPNCECEFVVGEYEENVYWDGNDWIATCLMCRESLLWRSGEPYEEPTRDYKSTICKLSDMLYDGFTLDEDTATEIAAMLVANGVTF